MTTSLLTEWAGTVARAERFVLLDRTGCPQCDATDVFAARDELERIIARGGRRAARIAGHVRLLDERFWRATTPAPGATVGTGWWRHRNLD